MKNVYAFHGHQFLSDDFSKDEMIGILHTRENLHNMLHVALNHIKKVYLYDDGDTIFITDKKRGLWFKVKKFLNKYL